MQITKEFDDKKNKSLGVKDKIKKIRRNALKNPYNNEFSPGKYRITDWLAMGLYQTDPDFSSANMLINKLSGFLNARPEFSPLIATAALWATMGIGNLSANNFYSKTQKYFKIIESDNILMENEDKITQGLYTHHNTVYISHINDHQGASTLVHETMHALAKLLYENIAYPFKKGDLIKSELWQLGTKNLMAEVHNMKANYLDIDQENRIKPFLLTCYDKDTYIAEIFARMIEYSFLFPNQEFPFSDNTNNFLKTAIANACHDAASWNESFIEETGLRLIDSIKNTPFLKGDSPIILDQELCRLLNKARQNKASLLDVVISEKLENGIHPKAIVTELVNKNIKLYSIFCSAIKHGHASCIAKIILDEFSMSIIEKDNALSQAKMSNHDEIVILLKKEIENDLCSSVTELGYQQTFDFLSGENNTFANVDEILPIAMAYAISNGYYELLQLLRTCNENANCTGNDILLAFQDALDEKDVELMMRIVEDENFSIPTDKDLDILPRVAKIGDPLIVETLLKKGAYIDASNIEEGGVTALMEAARKGRLEVVKLLIEKGANINAGDNEGRKALHCAVYGGNTDVMQTLLKAGADINTKENTSDFTPLHLAAEDNNIDMVRFLLEHGADASLTDSEGNTPLAQTTDDAIKVLLTQAVQQTNNKPDKTNSPKIAHALTLGFLAPTQTHKIDCAPKIDKMEENGHIMNL